MASLFRIGGSTLADTSTVCVLIELPSKLTTATSGFASFATSVVTTFGNGAGGGTVAGGTIVGGNCAGSGGAAVVLVTTTGGTTMFGFCSIGENGFATNHTPLFR
jgi:hypothetical protein